MKRGREGGETKQEEEENGKEREVPGGYKGKEDGGHVISVLITSLSQHGR